MDYFSSVTIPRVAPHSEWYKFCTDVTILKLWCNYCNKTFSNKNDYIPCPTCGKKAQPLCLMTPEQTEQMMATIEAHCHYPGEEKEKYDQLKESGVHLEFEDAVLAYDWWFEDREQVQHMWHLLKQKDGKYSCALRYFENSYLHAFHRDEY